MPEPSQAYSLRAIRDLLVKGFNVEELHGLFLYAANGDLHAAVKEFGPGDGPAAMARKAIEYCQSKFLLDELLAEIQRENPRAYAQFEDQLIERESPAAALVDALPADPGDELVGRDAKIKEIRELLEQKGTVVISGMGGVGKTALAARVAHLLVDEEERFGDAQLYLDLRGNDPEPVDPVDALTGLLNAITRPDPHRTREIPALKTLWHKAISGKDALLFLDNAASAVQVLPLLPASRTCAVLVTSRQRFNLGRAGRVELASLEPDAARELVQELAPHIDDGGADEIAQLCGGLPLALLVAGNYLNLNDDETAEEYALKLTSERTRLAELQDRDDPDLDVAAVLSLSVDRLAREDAELHRAWALLSLFAAPFDVWAAQSLWGWIWKPKTRDVALDTAKVADDVEGQLRDEGLDTEGFDGDLAMALVQMVQGLAGKLPPARWTVRPLPEGQTREHLRALRDRSLLTYDRDSKRWLQHDLVRLAASGAWESLDKQEKGEARLRFARHYEQVAREAKRTYAQGGEGVLEGLAIFDREWPHIGAGQAWAAAHAAEHDEVARLCNDFPDAASDFLPLRLGPHDWVSWFEPAIQAARQIGDREGEANHLGALGLAYKNTGEMEQAIDYYQQGLRLARETGDRRNEARHSGNLGGAYLILGDTEQAIALFQQAAEIADELEDRTAKADYLGSLGLAYQRLEETEQAIDQFQRALQLHRQAGDRLNEGRDLGNLGRAYHQLGETKKAIGYLEQSLSIAEEMGNRQGQGEDLSNLAFIFREQGDVAQARDHWSQAIELFEAIDDPRAEQVRSSLAELG